MTAKRLFQWHAALFPTGRNEWGHKLRVGGWRDDSGGLMETVSGAFGYEKVHYVAPPADRVEAEMSAFLEWFNGSHDFDPLVKAAIAHLWFVAIHPFGDGNGRITHAIADMTLAQSGGKAVAHIAFIGQISASGTATQHMLGFGTSGPVETLHMIEGKWLEHQ